MKVSLTPTINPIANIHSNVPIDAIEAEPMIHGGSPEFAMQFGGPLTIATLKTVLDKIKPGSYYVIDTKSVMLMPGFYPAIPGWHCDGVIRGDRHSQPDFSKMKPDNVNYVCTISDNQDGDGSTSRTEFVTDPITVEYDPFRVWGSIDKNLSARRGEFATTLIPDGQVTEFTQPTLHRATKSVRRGWRFFFRMSEYHMPPLNKKRHQVQVYMPESTGW